MTAKIDDWQSVLGQIMQSWPGAPGASGEELDELEERLKIALPPDYRAFLSTTNGWYPLSHLGGPVLPVTSVGWLRDLTPDLLTGWQEAIEQYVANIDDTAPNPLRVTEEAHLDYGTTQDTLSFRAEYLPQLLQISGFDEVTYLLNPAVRTPEGDWEAWALSAIYPGARRFRTFFELARHECATDPSLFPAAAERVNTRLAGLPRPAGFAHGSAMRPGQHLRRQSLTSPSGVYTLAHQNDGDLVLYRYSDGHPMWAAGTAGTAAGLLTLEENGNLVLLDARHQVLWESGTSGQPVDRLSVDDSGNVLLADSAGTVLWSARPW